jgi:hypothetical protein
MKEPLAEGIDYYVNEKGFVVLTEYHHLNRGYCCGLSCRHCPYHYEAVPEPKRTELLHLRQESTDALDLP